LCPLTETAASSGDEEHRRLEKRIKRLEAEAAAAAEEHAAELELLRSGLDARTRQEVADLERRLKAGLEKTRDYKKKQPSVFLFFLVFLGFLVFLDFFYIYLPRRESFLGLFSFKNTFRCIQTSKRKVCIFS
jgi:hypothetical protein